jgi:hypothetical protein
MSVRTRGRAGGASEQGGTRGRSLVRTDASACMRGYNLGLCGRKGGQVRRVGGRARGRVAGKS